MTLNEYRSVIMQSRNYSINSPLMQQRPQTQWPHFPESQCALAEHFPSILLTSFVSKDDGSGDEPTWDSLLATNALFESDDSFESDSSLTDEQGHNNLIWCVSVYIYARRGVELWYQMSSVIHFLVVSKKKKKRLYGTLNR